MESRKVLLYICVMTKTIKIPIRVHKELKRFIANNEKETIESVAGYSIMLYLKEMGHKFLPAEKNSKRNSKG